MKHFFIFIFFVSTASAQEINFTTGIATYAMKSMKFHGENLQKQFPVIPRVVEDFPPYVYYEISITQRINNAYVGGIIGYGSTGGRMNYTDYSGSISMDQNVHYFEVGGQLETLLNADATTDFFKLTLKPAVVFGQYALIISSRIGSQSDQEQINFKSMNVGLQPGFSYSRHIWKNVNLQVRTGYNINVYKGKLFLKENDAMFLQGTDGEKVTLDWSGFRVGIGVTFTLDKTI